MFYIGIFKTGTWFRASSHTNESDALVQKQRFIDSGISDNVLELTEDELPVEPE